MPSMFSVDRLLPVTTRCTLAVLLLTLSSSTGCLLFASPSDGGPGAIDGGPGGGDGGREDGGSADGGGNDGGGNDGGSDVDAGPFDAGPLDAGPFDGGDLDAGPDGGPFDGGDLDAGPFDAGPFDGGDGGPVDFEITLLSPTFTEPLLTGDQIVVSMQGSNLGLITSIEVDGFTTSEITVSDTDLTVTLTLSSLDPYLSPEIYEAQSQVAMTLRQNAFSQRLSLGTIELHRAHGPYVIPSAAPVTPCGHPLRPCATLNAALASFSARLNDQDARWSTTPFLRIGVSADPLVVTADNDTPVSIGTIGIVGGYVVPSEPSNNEWVGSQQRSTLLLAPGTSLRQVGVAPLSTRITNVLIEGQPLISGAAEYSALLVGGSLALENALIIGRHYRGAANIALTHRLSAVLVEDGGQLTADVNTELIGFRRSGAATVAQETALSDVPPHAGDVRGLEVNGVATFAGRAIGGLGIGNAVDGAVAAPMTVGAFVNTTGQLSLSGAAIGGEAPRPVGVRVQGGTLATTSTAVVVGGRSTASADAIENNAVFGLSSVGSAALTLNGKFISGYSENFATSIDVNSLNGAITLQNVGVHSQIPTGLLDDVPLSTPIPRDGRGVRIFNNADNELHAVVSQLDVEINARERALGLRVTRRLDGGGVTLNGAAANSAVIVRVTATEATAVGTGVEVGAGAAVNVDVRSTIKGQDADVLVGLIVDGVFLGHAIVALERLDAGASAGAELVGIRCGPTGTPAEGEIVSPSFLTLLPGAPRNTVSILNGDGRTTGLQSLLGCTASISETTFDLTAADDAFGMLARGSSTTMVNSIVVARGGLTMQSKGIDLECRGETSLTLSGMTIEAGDVGTEAQTNTGIEVTDSVIGVDPCTALEIDIDTTNIRAHSATLRSEGLTVGAIATVGDIPFVEVTHSTIASGVAPTSSGIALETGGMRIHLNSNEIEGAFTGAGNIDNKSAIRLAATDAVPDEVQLWNNYLHGIGTGCGVTVAVTRTGMMNTQLPIYLVHNTIAVPAGVGSAGVRGAIVSDQGALWSLGTLLGNVIASPDGTFAIEESCETEAVNILGQFQSFNGASNHFAGPTRTYNQDIDACSIDGTLPARYFGGASTNTVTFDANGCSSALPLDVQTSAISGAFGAGTFGETIPNQAYDGSVRAGLTRTGRCL